MRYFFSFLLCLTAHTATAQERQTIYVAPVEGVYTQNWIISDPVFFAAGIRTVTVLGEGKLGEFAGSLYVDCRDASKSKWLTVEDLFLDANDVPLEAIIALRDVLCNDS